MSEKYPDVIPMLSYENGIKAMDWLVEVFGFEEITRYISEDGVLAHGELRAGDGIIMLATPTPLYQSPNNHRKKCDLANEWLKVPWIVNGVLVYVNDLDAHYEKVKNSDAHILSEIEHNAPGKRYRVEDFEGNRWFFFEKS
jgi:uncharacterized glyoxalase superfamily protein PhnB